MDGGWVGKTAVIRSHGSPVTLEWLHFLVVFLPGLHAPWVQEPHVEFLVLLFCLRLGHVSTGRGVRVPLGPN